MTITLAKHKNIAIDAHDGRNFRLHSLNSKPMKLKGRESSTQETFYAHPDDLGRCMMAHGLIDESERQGCRDYANYCGLMAWRARSLKELSFASGDFTVKHDSMGNWSIKTKRPLPTVAGYVGHYHDFGWGLQRCVELVLLASRAKFDYSELDARLLVIAHEILSDIAGGPDSRKIDSEAAGVEIERRSGVQDSSGRLELVNA